MLGLTVSAEVTDKVDGSCVVEHLGLL